MYDIVLLKFYFYITIYYQLCTFILLDKVDAPSVLSLYCIEVSLIKTVGMVGGFGLTTLQPC